MSRYGAATAGEKSRAAEGYGPLPHATPTPKAGGSLPRACGRGLTPRPHGLCTGATPYARRSERLGLSPVCAAWAVAVAIASSTCVAGHTTSRAATSTAPWARRAGGRRDAHQGNVLVWEGCDNPRHVALTGVRPSNRDRVADLIHARRPWLAVINMIGRYATTCRKYPQFSNQRSRAAGCRDADHAGVCAFGP